MIADVPVYLPERVAARSTNFGLPVRLRLSRRRGFDLQALGIATNGLRCVSVARPGMWGNHAAVRAGVTTGQPAVDAFRRWVETAASEAWKGSAAVQLCGVNLACWCALDAPCHADVLLDLAERGVRPTEAKGCLDFSLHLSGC